jgi:predicted PurR-regulated permease PerM
MTTPPGAAIAGVVPTWLVHLAALGWRVLVSVALGLVLVAIATAISTATITILVSIIIGATFAPFVLYLRDRGSSRTKAAGIVTLGAVLAIGGTILLISLAFLPYIPDIVNGIAAGVDSVKQALSDAQLPADVQAQLEAVGASLQTWLTQGAKDIAGSVATIFTIGILSIFLTFYLLQDGDKAWVWLVQAGSDWQRDRITSSGHEALERIGGYLRGTAVLAASDGISDFIFLVLLGVPLAGPLSVMVFMGGFIPYVGGFITTTILVLVTYSTVGFQAVVLLLIGITVMNIIQGNIMAPVIYGRTVSIHPALVLVALPAGAALAGIVGLFVVIPLVALVLAVASSLIAVIDVPPDPERQVPAIVPGWLDRLAQWSWRLLIGIAVIAAASYAAIQVPLVVVPIVLGIVLAATCAPLVAMLRHRGWRDGTSAIAVTGGSFLVVAAILVITLATLAGPLKDMVANAVSGSDSVNGSAEGSLEALKSFVSQYGAALLQLGIDLVSAASSLVVIVILSVLLLFYFLRDGEKGWARLLTKVAPWRRTEVEAAGGRAFNVLGGYMIGTGAISLFGAATQFLIMVVLGIPLAFPLAVLSFFGGFIPYIGSAVTTGIALLVTIAVGSPTAIAVMLIFTVVFNIVQGNFVAPLVYGRVVSLHPAIVLMAIPAGGQLAGIIGMFLIVPILGLVSATWRAVLRVIGEEPSDRVEPPPVAEPADGDVPGPAPTQGDLPVTEPGPA